MFEQASILKLRFATPVGNITTEDLWDLPLDSKSNRPSLKKLATELLEEIKKQPSEALDFFESTVSADPVLQLKFDIVKHIVTAKVADNKAKAEAKANESANKEILALIADKKKASLADKSIEELEAMIK